MGKNNYLYMDRKFVESYLPLYQKETFLFFSLLKKYQQNPTERVVLHYDEIRAVFPPDESDVTINNILVKFSMKDKNIPIFIYPGEEREVLYPIEDILISDNNLEMKFTKDAYRLFCDVPKNFFIDLDELFKIKTQRNRMCYDVKMYMSISYMYELMNTNSDVYIPFTADYLYFILSIFPWNEEDVINEYLGNMPLYELVTKRNGGLYGGTTSIWTNVRYFIKQAISNISKYTDLFVDDHVATVHDVNEYRKVHGVILKVMRKSKKRLLAQRRTDIPEFYANQNALKFLYEHN